ncbi:hypothetical protein [Catalinimonas alkaloidigena]|nr:hypothetical protein [Catalinimonas alkaloidigena]
MVPSRLFSQPSWGRLWWAGVLVLWLAGCREAPHPRRLAEIRADPAAFTLSLQQVAAQNDLSFVRNVRLVAVDGEPYYQVKDARHRFRYFHGQTGEALQDGDRHYALHLAGLVPENQVTPEVVPVAQAEGSAVRSVWRVTDQDGCAIYVSTEQGRRLYRIRPWQQKIQRLETWLGGIQTTAPPAVETSLFSISDLRWPTDRLLARYPDLQNLSLVKMPYEDKGLDPDGKPIPTLFYRLTFPGRSPGYVNAETGAALPEGEQIYGRYLANLIRSRQEQARNGGVFSTCNRRTYVPDGREVVEAGILETLVLSEPALPATLPGEKELVKVVYNTSDLLTYYVDPATGRLVTTTHGRKRHRDFFSTLFSPFFR